MFLAVTALKAVTNGEMQDDILPEELYEIYDPTSDVASGIEFGKALKTCLERHVRPRQEQSKEDNKPITHESKEAPRGLSIIDWRPCYH